MSTKKTSSRSKVVRKAPVKKRATLSQVAKLTAQVREMKKIAAYRVDAAEADKKNLNEALAKIQDLQTTELKVGPMAGKLSLLGDVHKPEPATPLIFSPTTAAAAPLASLSTEAAHEMLLRLMYRLGFQAFVVNGVRATDPQSAFGLSAGPKDMRLQLIGNAGGHELGDLQVNQQAFQEGVDLVIESMGFENYIFGAKTGDKTGIVIHRATMKDSGVLIESLRRAQHIQATQGVRTTNQEAQTRDSRLN